MGDFIRENILPLFSLVFPLVMVSQFLISIVTKLFVNPKFKLYPVGPMEIGFNRLGPSLTLFGTLQILRKDAFITRMNVIVRHTTGKLERSFEWRAFKSYTFGLHADRQNIQLEPVAPFLLKAEAPHKYNIIFVDDSFARKGTRQADAIVDAWEKFQLTHPLAAGASPSSPNQLEVNDIETFLQQPPIQEIVKNWHQNVYWQAGNYQLEIQIYHTTKKASSFTYTFTLTDDEVDLLHDNVDSLLLTLMGQEARYKKVYVPYEEIT